MTTHEPVILTDDQRKAAKLMKSPRKRVGGYAGTGKTITIAAAATEMNDKEPGCVIVAAPTNKAASVLRTKIPARIPVMTIHSLTTTPKPFLEKDDDGNVVGEGLGFEPKQDPIQEHVMIDESSMFGAGFLGKIEHLFTSYCLIGDPMQLQPVKDTALMKRADLDMELTEVLRQDEGAYALAYATQLRTTGATRTPPELKVHDSVTPPMLKDINEPGHIVITYTNRDRHWFNKRCRMQNGARDWAPMVGDKMICRETDKETGLYNGMTGRVHELVETSDDRAWVNIWWDGHEEVDQELFQIDKRRLEGSFVPYQDQFGRHIEYAYAMTCHSAQGSSFKRVYICPSRALCLKNLGKAGFVSWLYTAVTRVEGLGDVIIIDT